jgi:hemerythrin-like domain-containing protein
MHDCHCITVSKANDFLSKYNGHTTKHVRKENQNLESNHSAERVTQIHQNRIQQQVQSQDELRSRSQIQRTMTPKETQLEGRGHQGIPE